MKPTSSFWLGVAKLFAAMDAFLAKVTHFVRGGHLRRLLHLDPVLPPGITVRSLSLYRVSVTYWLLLFLWWGLEVSYGSFSSYLALSVGAMWLLGAFVVFWLPEERRSLIKDTKYWITGYLLSLLVYRVVIASLAPITTQQVQVSLLTPVPGASGASMIGLFETLLMVLMITVPLGYVTWIVGHLRRTRTRQTKEETFARLRGNRRT